MSKIIELTRGFVSVIDDEDEALVNEYTWHVCQDGKTHYALTTWREGADRRTLSMHRLILNPPAGMLVDHIDMDGLNNQRANLRLVTNSQNLHRSRQAVGSSGYRGVRKCYDRWQAVIHIDGERIHLGTYDTPEEAAAVRDAKAKELFGTIAYQNFGDTKP